MWLITEKKKNQKVKAINVFKVKPLLEAVRANCNKIELEAIHVINQQIIPNKTKNNGGIC